MSNTTQTTLTTQFPSKGWITKKTAAERLKLTLDGVRGVVAARGIRTEKQRDPSINQLVMVLHEGDVERELWRREHPNEAVNQGDKPDTPPQPTPAPLLELPAPEEPKEESKPDDVWLTLRDAAKLSRGLSAASIERAIRNGALLCEVAGEKTEMLRVHRDELLAYRGRKYGLLT